MYDEGTQVETMTLDDLKHGIRIVVGSPDCVHFLHIKLNGEKVVIKDIDKSVYYDRTIVERQ